MEVNLERLMWLYTFELNTSMSNVTWGFYLCNAIYINACILIVNSQIRNTL